MKLAIITCYSQPNYVRGQALRTACAAASDVEVLDIRNWHTGWLRFIEVPLRLTKARFRDKPDAYLITFRGYEMLLFMVLTLVRRPIIFDELVNFTEWLEEHQKIRPGTWRYRLFRRWYAWLVGHCRFVLADTEAHARHSAELNRLALDRYRTIPVSTDESVFRPPTTKPPAPTQPFTVFYYGNMLPLHGLPYVLDAALLLKDQPDINFHIVGGSAKTAQACAAAAAAGARLRHEAWLPFEELPAAALAAGLSLGGPFGNTTQAQFVITGKIYQFLALGAPVLVGRNQVNDLFQDKLNCLMVPRADAAAIAAAVSWAYQHPKELAGIAQAGRQLYLEHFSQAVVSRLVQQLLQVEDRNWLVPRHRGLYNHK